MATNHLHIISAETLLSDSTQLQAHFEELWQKHPEQFDPTRNSMERERIRRTWFLTCKHFIPQGKQVVDLGCGLGILSLKLQSAGATVYAVDIAMTPLNILKNHLTPFDKEPIKTIQACLPHTTFDDNSFDLVLCTDLIAHLDKSNYRSLFSEMCRLSKPNGIVICSTPLDIHSKDAFANFSSLSETEFIIENWICSHHYLYIVLSQFFSAPADYWKSYRAPLYRSEQLKKRPFFRRFFYRMNTLAFPAFIWKGVAALLMPFSYFLMQRRWLMLVLEKLSSLLWKEAAISHAIFIGRRRSLAMTTQQDVEWRSP